MSLEQLRIAADAKDAALATQIWTATHLRDHRTALRTLAPEAVMWLLEMRIIDRRRHFGDIPFLHVLAFNASRIGVAREMFSYALQPRYRNIVEIECEIGGRYVDKPDVRTTALRCCLNQRFHFGIKKLLMAGASTVRVVSAADAEDVLLPYRESRASCARVCCALLWRYFMPFGLNVPRDLRVLMARMIWARRYSARWRT